MSVLKYKDPVTGKWTSVPILKVLSIGESSDLPNITGIPDDIVTEANRVASSIPTISGNSITFIAMSDMHEFGDGDLRNNTNLTDSQKVEYLERHRRANRNAGQGARLIADKISPDFFANLGDLAWGDKACTVRKDSIDSIIRARGCTFELHDSVESFFTPGNHDARYWGGSEGAYSYHDAELTECLIGSYRYVDFASKKVRVICANTADISDGVEASERVSGEQLQWFANALDLSAKADSAEWGIIVLSHHPMDWGEAKPLANCLAAYLNGTTYSVTHDGVSISKNFGGKNAATFIANFHGHTHCFLVANISGTTAKRVAIPNACYSRNNEYGKDGNTEFGETTTYAKRDDGTGKNTAFCVVSVDLSNKIIYANCFGAGYDRVVNYAGEEIITYNVTNNLTNATSSNTATLVVEGTSYYAEVSAISGYALESVTVTMGGNPVEVTTNGDTIVIDIDAVDGDIVISAMAKSSVVYNVNNLVTTSEEADSTSPYNGVGYKNGVYCSSEGGDSSDSAFVSTGYIPYTWSSDNVIYVRGAKISNASHIRIYGYTGKGVKPSSSACCSGPTIDTYFTLDVVETDTYYRLTPKVDLSIIKYLRLSLSGKGENLIITVNEPIE